MEIYIEPIMRKNRLYIFGAGHTGCALAKYALDFDFEVVVIDDRKEFIDQIKFPGINKLDNDYGRFFRYCLWWEYLHSIWPTASFWPRYPGLLPEKAHAYLGMIGSQRKVEMTKKMFEEGMIATKNELDEVDMPMGITIGAEGPKNRH